MPKENNAKVEAQGASFEERMKMQVNVSESQVKGVFRGAKVLTAGKTAFEELTIGISNSSIRKGEVFRVLKPGLIEQKIGGNTQKLPILYIENTKGEQRPIYASGIMRSTPTRNSEQNEYGPEVLEFNRGLLQGTQGMSFPQIFEKLVGDGEQFIHVTDSVPYTTKGHRLNAQGLQNTDPDTAFTANQTAFALELVDKATALELSPISA